MSSHTEKFWIEVITS